MDMPDPDQTYPIRLPDGSRHQGTIHVNRMLDHPNIDVGDYTYYSDFDPPADGAALAARLAPYLFPNSSEMLRIGKFCQIAHGTRFITASANHPAGLITSYPFQIFDPAHMANYHPDERDTRIGNDVWLGYNSMVLPGATVGNGVIVGAGSVVRGDIPDYAVVIGNPAQVIRMRFPEAEIETLNELAWWDWPAGKIAAHRLLIEGSDVTALAKAAATPS
ncbi:CatB-related O-acetyltransferase [Aestuariibius insulae]|uniref:CatB-related O-acetyltransferase n=1 Tax=Aestuariibius insulae TaxID=2058287 RepID=UPI00398F6F9C